MNITAGNQYDRKSDQTIEDPINTIEDQINTLEDQINTKIEEIGVKCNIHL